MTKPSGSGMVDVGASMNRMRDVANALLAVLSKHRVSMLDGVCALRMARDYPMRTATPVERKNCALVDDGVDYILNLIEETDLDPDRTITGDLADAFKNARERGEG